MNENLKNFLPGGISDASKEREARLAQLSAQVSAENMHDGSPTSLEFARSALTGSQPGSPPQNVSRPES